MDADELGMLLDRLEDYEPPITLEDLDHFVDLLKDELGGKCVDDVKVSPVCDDSWVARMKVYRDDRSDGFMEAWIPIIVDCLGGQVHIDRYFYTVEMDGSC